LGLAPRSCGVTARGEGLAAGLKLRIAVVSRSGDAATGSLKLAAQGNRVRGFPCYKQRRPIAKAVPALKT